MESAHRARLLFIGGMRMTRRQDMTNRELKAEDIGAELGNEGVGGVVSKVEAYCAYEEKRIALTNEPRVVALRAEASWLLDEERELVERLRQAPPPGDLRSRRRKAIYHGCVAAFLIVAAFVFSLYSFEPFRLGYKAYFYCLGIAIVTPFLLERVIDWWKAETLIKALALVACAAALASLVLLAVVRGDLLAESIKGSSPVVTIDDAPQQALPPENNFYDRTTPILQLVMAMLALAMELGAGLALHEAWRPASDTKEDWAKLRKRLSEVRGQLTLAASEIVTLEREPQVFAARFWRNFYRSMITHTLRSAMTKLLVGLVAIVLMIQGHALAQSHTAIVVALDLTKSENVRNPDGKTEFDKNVEAVTKLLAQAPADSSVTVIGITDRSFAQPDILLSATIPADAGYFGERLAAARRELVRAWKAKSARLEPRYRQTDIIGALVLAGQIFDEHSETNKKTLVIYSDMRNSTSNLNLESPNAMPTFKDMKQRLLTAGLHEVNVFALGVDGAAHTTAAWLNLKAFWEDYFAYSAAHLASYSVLHELPDPQVLAFSSATER
jgi:hypothetical protein